MRPTFWLPSEGLYDKARADRIPYELWETTPGPAVAYEYIAWHLRTVFDQHRVTKIASTVGICNI